MPDKYKEVERSINQFDFGYRLKQQIRARERFFIMCWPSMRVCVVFSFRTSN